MGAKANSEKGLSDKEAALIAAARRDLARAPVAMPCQAVAKSIPSDGNTPPPIAPAAASVKSTMLPAKDSTSAVTLAPLVVDVKPDIATRMALLLAAERDALNDRKRRIKRNYIIGITAVMVPAFLYVIVNLFRILVR